MPEYPYHPQPYWKTFQLYHDSLRSQWTCVSAAVQHSLSHSLGALLLWPCQTAAYTHGEEPEPEPCMVKFLLISLLTVFGSLNRLKWKMCSSITSLAWNRAISFSQFFFWTFNVKFHKTLTIKTSDWTERSPIYGVVFMAASKFFLLQSVYHVTPWTSQTLAHRDPWMKSFAAQPILN